MNIQASPYTKLFWNEFLLAPESYIYNMCIDQTIFGELNTLKLEQAIRLLTQEHLLHGARLEEQKGELVWKKMAQFPKKFLHIFSSRKELIDYVHTPFDLEEGYLSHGGLYKVTDNHYEFVFKGHHILYDGISTDELYKKLSYFYNNPPTFHTNLDDTEDIVSKFHLFHSRVKALKTQYHADKFWGDMLKDFSAKNELPYFPHSQKLTEQDEHHKYGAICFFLSKAKWLELKKEIKYANEFLIFKTLFALFIARVCQSNKAHIAYPIALKGAEAIKFTTQLNTVIFPLIIEEDDSFKDLYQKTLAYTKSLRAAPNIRYTEYPIYDVLAQTNALQPNVSFTQAHMRNKTFDFEGCKLEPNNRFNHDMAAEIILEYQPTEDGFNFKLRYQRTLFEDQQMIDMAEQFQQLLYHCLQNVDQKLFKIPYLTNTQYETIVKEFNKTKYPEPEITTLHETISKKAREIPELIALVDQYNQYSYREMDELATKMAQIIQAKYQEFSGVPMPKESLIGICAHRHIDTVVALLAILKSGGAYVPMDNDYPQDRLEYIIADSGLSLIITEEDICGRFTDLPIATLTISELKQNNGDAFSALPSVNPNQLAYVIYTSGTTGKPKGTMLSHRGIANMAHGTRHHLYQNLKPHATCMHFAALVFDPHAFEIFGALFAGNRLVVASQEARQDTKVLLDLIEQHKVNFAPLPPALLKLKIDFPNSLRDIALGGESTPLDVLNYYMGQNYSIYNLYGPTEASVWVSFNRYNYNGAKNIGRPLNNTKLYVLDPYLKPLPIGVFGELYIAGLGLARGYLNLPELTEDRFINNPFTDKKDYTKLYKTGDLVRRLSNGEIEYIGRDDFQVKIRGYRIELSEIETVLNQIVGVNQSAVITYGEETPRLVAYYVSKEDIDKNKIYDALNERLPDYMIPSSLMKIDALPKTINDKLDIQALPEPIFSEQSEYEAPTTDLEITCCNIWSSFLNLEEIGINDNFFRLGGNSIMAIQICNCLSTKWAIPVSVILFTRYPTIQAFCQQLQKQNDSATQIATHNQDYAPLSFAQSRLWFIENLLEGSSAYHIPILLELDKAANISSIELSLQALIKRHKTLRTQIHQDENGVPYQKVIKNIVKIEIHDAKTNNQQLEQTIHQQIDEPFDLVNGVPIRATLIKSELKQYLLITIHHIAFDGWSTHVFLEELNGYYQHFSKDTPFSPKSLSVQYTDYSIWQNETLREKQEGLTSFWKNKLSGYELLGMPTDFVRPLQFDYSGENLWFSIDSSLTKTLKNLAQTLNVTLHALFLSSCNILLSCYANQRDIIIGTPVANRPYPQLDNLIGFFVNSLVLRNQCTPSLSIANFIKTVFENTMECQAHQDMSFEQLISCLDVPRDPSRNPLFQIMFILEEQQKSQADWFEIKQLDSFDAAKFDLTLFFKDCGDEINIAFNYCSALFKQETIQRMQQHLMQILKQIAENPQINIAQINILTEKERKQVLYTWNDTKQRSSLEPNLHEAIASIARKHPQALALTDDGGDMSYAELDKLSTIQAKYIRARYTEVTKQDLPHEALIGLCTYRHKEMIVAMLAILKAGGAYVPMDTTYPQERIEYIANNSNMVLVITESDIAPRFDHLPVTIVSIDELKHQLLNDVSDPLPRIDSKHLAYVIYTSGTTGKPKGTLLEHKGVLNMVLSSQQLIHHGISDGVTVLQFASIVFDAHVYEIYLALLSGYRLVIAPQSAREDLEELIKLIATYQVNTGLLPPALLKLKPDLPSSLKHIAVGGESTPLDVLEHYTNKGVDIYNLYGPTEASVWVCMNRYKHNGAQNIGRPMSNTKLYVLNEFMLPVPIGIVGELFISGLNLSRGYIGLNELTNQAFITNPFESDHDYKYMYRTGDLVRWQSDGSIEYIGRNDHQVKIRGHRIELHEIEQVLNQLDFIQQSAVIVHGEDIKHIVAYCVVDTKIDSKDIQKRLAEFLPEHMVPSAIMAVESLPMTINGKLDVKLLPRPIFNNSQKTYEKPANKLEQQCCDIWSSLLKVNIIGVHNNFYSLGGTSIIAIQICNQLSKKLNRKISVASFTSHPTIRGFCDHLIEPEGNNTAVDKIISHQQKQSILSFSQSRLWFIEILSNKQNAYHVPILLHLNLKTDFDLLKQSILNVMERHEVLRSVIQEDAKGIPYQQVKPANLKIKELLVQKKDWDKTIRQVIEMPFNLTQELPIKVTLLRRDAEVFCLINVHHIAFDGWSTNVFLDELNQFYQHFSKNTPLNITSLNLQYSDYAIWENKSLEKRLDILLSFWQKQLKNYEPLNLPTDFKRPNEFDYQGTNQYFSISKELTHQLHRLAKSLGVTLQSVIFSAFNLLLSRYSNQKDIIIGIPVANRSHSELEGLIGFFVNSVVLRNQCLDDISVSEFIKSVFNNTNTCQEHQDMPFEQLVKHLNIPRDSEVNPLFQVMFSFNQGQKKHHDWFNLEAVNQYDAAKFDLTAVFEDHTDVITGGFNYATALFKSETIKRMGQHLQEILKQMVANESAALKDISVLTPVEYQWAIYHLNQTAVDEPSHQSLHEGISIQAQKTPKNVALIDNQKSYTYAEIDHLVSEQARSIRAYYKALKQHEMPQETLIGLCTDRHAKMIIAMLAILKAGGAYVPMDKTYPKDRLEYIVQNSKMALVITEDTIAEHFTSLAIATVTINQLEAKTTENIESFKLPQVKSDQLAYVIYTSGTTGKPKGTLLSHRGVINMVSSTQQNIYKDLVPKATVLQFSSIVFDAHVLETYSALLSGYSLVVASQSAREDIDELLLLIKSHQVNTALLPPALLKLKPQLPASITHIAVGGEASPLEILNHYQADSRQLFNLYGPTEASVWASMNHYKNNGAQNIGRSKNNMKLYVLNEYLQPTPIGVTGELYISGVGLAKGYLKQEKLTKETFLPNPFESHPDYQRMYKTGDMVRMLPNGDLEYIGRNDYQVKIRGHRIELSEIEHAINTIEGIGQSVVLIHETSVPKIIVYFVSANHMKPSFIRKELSQLLPAYMLPSAIIQIEAIPVTINGKIDTHALPQPDFSNNKKQRHKTQPETLLEQKIYTAWQMILGFEVIGLEDNFFDLGGDSIAIIRLISELRRIGLHVSVKDIYTYHTIQSLADFIASQNSNVDDILTEQGVLTGSFNLLPIQEWFFNENFTQPHHWNQTFLIKVPPLDTHKLQACISQLVEHHDMLRVTFNKNVTMNHQQTIHEYVNQPKLKVCHRESIGEDDLQVLLTSWQDHFNYEKNALWQFGYIDGYEDGSARIFCAFHHLIIDSVSWRILTQDLKLLYEGKPLGLKGTSFRQWQSHLNNMAEKAISQTNFWLTQTAHPVDYIRDLARSKTSHSHIETRSIENTYSLLSLCEQLNLGVNEFMLAALVRVLSIWTGHQSHNLLLESHGRDVGDEPMDLGGTVGWFTSMYPVKFNLLENQLEYVKNIQHIFQSIPDNGLMYGVLKYLNNEPINHHPSSVMFNYLGQFNATETEWAMVAEKAGEPLGRENVFSNILSFNALISDYQLSYSLNGYLTPTDLSKFNDDLLQSMHQLAAELKQNIPVKPFNLIKSLNEYQEGLPSIWMIHPGGYDSDVYEPIAEVLNGKINCFGIDSYNLNNEQQIEELTDLADYYLDEMKKHPAFDAKQLHILGWSTGGVIGAQICANLEQNKVKNISLYLLDTLYLSQHNIDFDNHQLKNILRDLEKQSMTPDQSYRVIMSSSSGAKISSAAISQPLLQSKAILFKALEKHTSIGSSEAERFLNIADNHLSKICHDLEIINLNCNHYSILDCKQLVIDRITDLIEN